MVWTGTAHNAGGLLPVRHARQQETAQMVLFVADTLGRELASQLSLLAVACLLSYLRALEDFSDWLRCHLDDGILQWRHKLANSPTKAGGDTTAASTADAMFAGTWMAASNGDSRDGSAERTRALRDGIDRKIDR